MKRSMVRFGALAFAVLAVPPAVSAQEALWPLGTGQQVEVEELPMKATLVVAGRLSAMAGEIDPYVPVDYEDLFGAGVGVAVEGSLLWEVDYQAWMGAYVSVGWDDYDGKRDTDAWGDSLEADGMEVTTFLVGLKWDYFFTPRVYVDAHIAIGAVHYGVVEGTYTEAGIPERVDIFDSTTAGAFDLGGRIGYTRKRFVAEIGFGMRLQGAPDSADFDFDSTGPAVFALEAGLGLRF